MCRTIQSDEEIERLRTREEKAVAIIGALVGFREAGIYAIGFGGQCAYCAQLGELPEFPHKDDCPICKGRKWLTDEGAPHPLED